MDDAQFAEIAAWTSTAGLEGQDEAALVSEFCARVRALGVPLARVQVFIDTLHPVHGGRLCSWRAADGKTDVREYQQPNEGENQRRWERSPFFRLLQTGESLLRRRVTSDTSDEFPLFAEFHADGMTDYVAIIDRFGADAVIGDMDCVYSSWLTDLPAGFSDWQIKALRRLTPTLALAIKSAMLGRIAMTLVETYLGRDPGHRVLQGSIARGASASIEAVLWFSDLHGYTHICDRTPPQEIIPLLNDYADAVISAIHDQGGDVLKLIGDGTLAMFTGDDRGNACRAALMAARRALADIADLKQRRLGAGLPATDLYLGLHLGEVVYGNFGSRERLDFTVVGPAVNEVSRIAGMCRLVDQPLLASSAFFGALGPQQSELVSVGRYALRGVGRSQDLYTLEGAG